MRALLVVALTALAQANTVTTTTVAAAKTATTVTAKHTATASHSTPVAAVATTTTNAAAATTTKTAAASQATGTAKATTTASNAQATSTVKATPTSTPPPPSPANVHALLKIKAKTDSIDLSALATTIESIADLDHESFRLHPISTGAETTTVHLFGLGGPKSSGLASKADPKKIIETAAAMQAIGGLAASSEFQTGGGYPLDGTPSFEFNGANMDFAYQCGDCEHKAGFGDVSPVCAPIFQALPKFPFATDPSDSPLATAINLVAAQAAAGGGMMGTPTSTPPPMHPPTHTPSHTPTKTPMPMPTPTGTMMMPPPQDPPQCAELIGAVMCQRGYPICGNSKPVLPCRSMCEALISYCPGVQIDQLAMLIPGFNLTATCDNADIFEQNLNSPTTPCLALWDLPWLFYGGAKPGETVCPVEAVDPSATVPVKSQVSATTLSSTARPVRAKAVIEVTKGITTPSVPSVARNQFATDIVGLLGIDFANLTVSEFGEAGTGDAIKVFIFFRVAKNGDSYLTPTNIKEMLTAGLKTTEWTGRWGTSTLTMEENKSVLNCGSCPAKDIANVHPACQTAYSELYNNPAYAYTDTVSAAVSASFSLVASPQAQEIGRTCLGYMQDSGCAFYYPPCDGGKPLRMCASTCNNIEKFCEEAKLALVKGSSEAGALSGFLNCTDPESFVQPGEDEKCFDAYDNNFIVNAPCTDSGSVPVPVADVDVSTLVDEDPNPTTITVCGADCNGIADAARVDCPISAGGKFTMKPTQCVDYVGGEVCTPLTTCGTTTVDSTKTAYYKYTGTSRTGTFSMFSDATCETALTSTQLSETSCTKGLKLVTGGISVAKVTMSFGGALTDAQKGNVEAKMLEKVPELKSSFVTFTWSNTGTRAAETTLEMEIGAPLNVKSSSTGSVGATLANSIADKLAAAVDSDDFKAELKTAAGGAEPSGATVSAAVVEDDDSGSGSVLVIIIIIIIVLVIIAAVVAAVLFVMQGKKKGGSKKKKISPTDYDDEEEGYGGA